MGIIRKLAFGFLILAALFYAAYLIDGRIVASKNEAFEKALSQREMSEALSGYLRIARTERYSPWHVPLGRRFWLEANRNGRPIQCDSSELTTATDHAMVNSLRLALDDIVRTSETLSTMHLLRVSQDVLQSRTAEQNAIMLLAVTALHLDLENGVRILPRIPEFDPSVLKVTPSEVLGLALYFEDRHQDLVQLRRERIPELRPPLSVDDQSLLAVEVLSTRKTKGTTEAAALAGSYLDLRLFTHPKHLTHMRTAAGRGSNQVD